MMGFSCLFTLFKAGVPPRGLNPWAVFRKHPFSEAFVFPILTSNL